MSDTEGLESTLSDRKDGQSESGKRKQYFKTNPNVSRKVLYNYRELLHNLPSSRSTSAESWCYRCYFSYFLFRRSTVTEWVAAQCRKRACTRLTAVIQTAFSLLLNLRCLLNQSIKYASDRFVHEPLLFGNLTRFTVFGWYNIYLRCCIFHRRCDFLRRYIFREVVRRRTHWPAYSLRLGNKNAHCHCY